MTKPKKNHAKKHLLVFVKYFLLECFEHFAVLVTEIKN